MRKRPRSRCGAVARGTTSGARRIAGALLGVAVSGIMSPVAAQAGTDVWLASLSERNGRLEVGVPSNITRRPGYDNQPGFTADGRSVLFTRIEDGQADIARYEIAGARIDRVTSTRESEYSATPVPGRDAFSVIRVEADSTQRLWQFPFGGGEPSIVLRDVAPVGYHAWADENTLVLFVLGRPPTLHVADVRTGRAREAARDIGRSIQKIPGRRGVSFAQRTDAGIRIDELDLSSGAIRPLVAARPGGEFHAWTPGGVLLMGEGPRLYRWKPGDPDWTLVADFTAQDLRISRLAVSPGGDWIALVSEETARDR